MTIITINGTMTLDESLGLQTGGIAIPGEDNNDSDVSLGTLQTGVVSFYNRLFNSIATGGLGLSTTFATNNGVAESASNFITVSGGTVASLGFVDGSGGALPTYAGVATGGVATQLSALNGGAISLFADATLGNRMVLGVDANNDIVFAIFMDPNAALTSSRVWMVQFEAISNPNASNPDDSVNLFDSIGVAATTTLNFDFNSLHSGSNLFGAVGDTTNSLIVIAEHPVINQTTGEFSTAPNGVIKTSQGGGPTTIGVNSQMFDPGEGAYFTYVKGSVSDVLGANLSQTEANNANNIQYTNGTNAALGASLTITQTQGNSTASMKITCYDIAGSPQSLAFVNGLGSGAIETITSVKVNGVAVSFTVDGNGVIVSGLHAGDTISWTTSAPHDRVLIEGVAGKFDIGGFAITSANSASVDIGQQLTFEDSGPSAAIGLGTGSVTHDESSGAQNTNGATDSATAIAALTPNAAGGVSNASTDYLTDDPSGSIYATSAAAVVQSNNSSFGADEEGASKAYSLSVAAGGVDSGLTTTDGTKIFLFKEGDVVVGRIGADATAALGGLAAFAVAIDSSGFVSVAQYASLKHGSAETNGDASEAVSITNAALQAVVTVTDGDGDTATNSVNIGDQVKFLDDGPTAAIGLGTGSVTHDESSGAQNTNGATDSATAIAALTPNAAGGVSNASTDYLTDDPSGSIYATSAAAVVQSNNSSFGADEEGASKAYSLSVAAGGVDSGLTTTDGTKIFLFKEGDVVVGRIGADAAAAASGLAAFAVAIDSSGFVSVAQYASLKHGSAETNGDASEAVSITNAALQAVVTVTDGDGDTATNSVNIGDQVKFLDDGPTAAIGLGTGSVTHDESSGAQNTNGATDSATAIAALTPNAAGGVSNASTDYLTDDPSGSIYATSAAAVVQSNNSSFGADEEGASKAYSLSVAAGGVDSGLTTTDGTKIFLFKEGDVVVGRIGADAAAAASGLAAFAVAIDSSGFVSVAQYASLKHGSAETNGDASEAVSITNAALQAVVTVTDGDGDTATNSVNIGDQVKFLDDGPTAAIGLGTGSVTHDESSGAQNTNGATDSATAIAALTPNAAGGVSNASTDYLTDDPSGSIYATSAAAVVQSNNSSFGADEEGASKAYSLSVAAGGVDSGLTTTDGTKIFLFKEGDVVVGRIGADAAAALGGLAAFAVAIDSSGFVSVAQYASLKHGSAETNGDISEAVSITNAALQAVVTVTDGDGDTATNSVDIGGQVKFLDDGPSITVNNITNGTYAAGGSSTWPEAPGADGFKSLAITLNDYTIDSHSTVTVNSLLGTDTTTDASGNYVFNGTINADFNGDGISDSVAFTLAFKPGADTYTISVTTPPPSIVTFDTSQGSLAPGGPNPVQSLTFSSGPAAGQSVVFFGAVATSPAKLDNVADNPPNDILDLVGLGQPDLTKAQINALLGPPNQISSLINGSTQMNVSTSGIGINNNNLDGSGAGIQSTDESFVVNPSQLVDQVKVFIDNSVGGYNPGTEDLEYRVYYSDGTVSANTKVQAGDLTNVTSGVAAGGKSFVISDVAGGPQIDAVQLTMANGTIKIPVIQFSIQQSFLPQPLNMNLTATLTDGDNDTSKSTFSIALA